MSQIFISYARKDWDAVDAWVRRPIEACGFTPWVDTQGIVASQEWERVIRKALHESQWFLPVLSANSAASTWVRREVAWAMDNRSENIVPVALEPINLDDWHLGLRSLQVLNLWDKKQNLEATLKHLIGTPRQETSQVPAAMPANVPRLPSALNALANNYYCYISVSKVNNLFAQLGEQDYTATSAAVARRIVELQSKMRLSNKGGSASQRDELARLNALQRLVTMSFGARPGAGVEREDVGLESTQSLIGKLRAVLMNMISNGEISDLVGGSKRGGRTVAFVHRGPHQVVGIERGMATIQSKIGSFPFGSKLLRLNASMKYFNDMSFSAEDDGSVHASPHSANHAFFAAGGPAYDLVSISLITARKGNVIFGSPICMMLDAQKGLSL